MRILALSDTHNQHTKLNIPECDLLIHAGDVSVGGHSYEIDSFLSWFSNQPATYKIFVPGNHDLDCETNTNFHAEAVSDVYGVTVLMDRSVTIEGIKIYGNPAQFSLPTWAFYKNEDPYIYWNRIPDGTDILVTHVPPYKILDRVVYQKRGEPENTIGDKGLIMAIACLDPMPKLHIFGHIHESHGTRQIDPTLFCNVAILDENYKLVHEPTKLTWS